MEAKVKTLGNTLVKVEASEEAGQTRIRQATRVVEKVEKLGETLAYVKVRRLVNTLCKSLLKLEVKTLLHTDRHAKCNSSQDNNNKTIAFTLKKKQAKALIKTLAKSQGDVDV